MTKFNNILTVWKLVIPTFVAIILMLTSFHPSNFVDHGGLLPEGFHGVFSALAIGGILFAFNGFKQSVELAGEAENPRRAVFFGILGSIIIAMFIYTILQFAFISSLPKHMLANGWANIKFLGDAGPLAGLLLMFGLFWMAIILYVDAVIAPASASLVFSSSAGRLLYGMSVNKQMPKIFSEISPFGTPGKAIVANFVVGMIFFFPFPGWHAMIEFLSSLIAVSYVTGPICALTLRYRIKDYKRPFKLPFITLWTYLALFICMLIAYWTGWIVISKLMIALFVSLILYFIYRRFSARAREIEIHWKTASWLWVFMIGLAIISWLGDYGGGKDYIPFGWDFLCIGILAAITLLIAVKYSLSEKEVAEHAQLLHEEALKGRPIEVPFFKDAK